MIKRDVFFGQFCGFYWKLGGEGVVVSEADEVKGCSGL
jgi:hypothetical protein